MFCALLGQDIRCLVSVCRTIGPLVLLFFVKRLSKKGQVKPILSKFFSMFSERLAVVSQHT